MTEIANSWNVSNRYLTGLGKVCPSPRRNRQSHLFPRRLAHFFLSIWLCDQKAATRVGPLLSASFLQFCRPVRY